MQMAVNIDDRDVKDGIRSLIRAGNNLRPVFLRLKKPFKEDIKDHQKRREGPDGAWAPRAQSTKDRDKHGKSHKMKSGKVRRFKRRRKNKLLGKLPTSVTTKQNPDSFVGESKVPWAMAQQEGGGVGRNSVLPSRTFLFFSKSFLDLAEDAIGKHLQIGWQA
jgi:phage gpG-like protein